MHLVFHGSSILLAADGSLHLPGEVPPEVSDPPGGALTMQAGSGRLRIWVAESDRWPRDGAEFHGLRSALGRLDDKGAALAGRARQLLEWRRDHRFCGRCGAETRLDARESGLECTACGHTHFPRVTPAVIVLVHDGRRLLLGRAPRFPDGMYSTLAGFVEPGETAEETVHREVLEESGVRIGALEYRGSQSWPFPHSLMLGYHARWAGGEIRCEDEELEDVRWFDPDDLPRLPTHRSIARRLIDDFLSTLDES